MKREGTIDSPPVQPAGMTTSMIAPDHAWELIENLVMTEEGGLRSAYGPIPVTPNHLGLLPANGRLDPDTPTYGPCNAVFHAKVGQGQRDILIIQTEDELWEFIGHSRKWRQLVANDAGALLRMELPIPLPSDAPTQFIATPTGIVILPQRGSPIFYDGGICLRLGYGEAPHAPVGMGPGNSASDFFPDNTEPYFGVNDTGYTMDALDNHPPSKMFPVWKGGRIGTIDTPGDVAVLADLGSEEFKSQVMGYLLPGRWRARVQFIDYWGNLSPWSGESNDITVARQPAMKLSLVPPYTLAWVHADKARKQFAWNGIAQGPTGTIGRLVSRTKDLINSGDTKFYVVPRDSSVVPGAFATLPDNMSTCYPDNIPDAWLFQECLDVAPMPEAKVGELAFGRMFYAGVQGDEGALFWSEPGRWGTVLRKSKSYPDPAGAGITCLRRVEGGLVAFTENSVFRIVPNDAGDGFKPDPIDAPTGTVSPNSVRLHRNGMLIFLGSDASFYGYDGNLVQNMWADMKLLSKRIQRGKIAAAAACYDTASNEYRCWVSALGSEFNNRCFIFDGATWRQRNDMWASDVCVTQDSRRLMIAVGRVDAFNRNGVWVIDRAGLHQTATCKTAWIAANRSQERRHVTTVFLHLRETGIPGDDSPITINVRKNYRNEITESKTLQTHYPAFDTAFNSGAISPTIWDDNPGVLAGTWGASTSKWRRRRPFWVKVDIGNLVSVESFQFEIVSDAKMELLDYYWTERPRDVQGAMNPRGSTS